MAFDLRAILRTFSLWLCILNPSFAFYIPVNKAYSDRTQLQFPYYDLPFTCPPSGKSHGGSPFGSGQSISQNLGEVLRGDRIMTSDFEVHMGKDIECQYLCQREMDRKDVKRTQKLIEDGYVIEWILDNLPGATSFVTVDRSKKYYAAGFKMGYKDFSPQTGKPRYFLNNHYTMVVRWRKAPGKAGANGGKVVVGFEVYTKSIEAGNRNATGCPAEVTGEHNGMAMYIEPNNTALAAMYPHSSYLPEDDEADDGATITVPFTYSIYFRQDDTIDWSNRWDMYFSNQDETSITHWLAIINSLIISGILGAIVVVIWSRTMQGDIKGRGDGLLEDGKFKGRSRRSRGGLKSPKLREKTTGLLEKLGENDADLDISSDEESIDDITGWKLLHGDVFRPPPYGGLLAPLIGSGMQLLFMTTGLLLLSCFGVLNPSFRGGFVSVGVGLFVFAGVFSGYFSGRVYKTFNGQNWRKNTIMTATLFPGLLFCLIFILNLFVWAQASSTALPFGTLIALVALWLLIQVPLVYIGSWYGYYKADAWEHPTKTTSIPRQIPPQSWYMKNYQGILIAGLIPFAVLFIELLFVFKSLWQDKSGYYYVFGFLSVVSVILVITVSEVTIIATYVQLCSENYHWWWQSFFVGGASAFWIFVYCVCAIKVD
ncbi:putative multispanning membrane [Phaeomoniella chlamydospora]|uniref:Transmembrane 9 superfamily member n=1 Tax=Phaeomoniella chlamydospora TaxID=158046 RepID=A0A0G2GDN3_PHACM|nr:putative multispanning membrane [Phaeomoniella chlamydospora]